MQPKSLRSNWVGSSTIHAALLYVVLSGCTDQQTTGPELPSVVSPTRNVAFSNFFVAWSQGHSANPIQTQTFALDARQERQYADWWADEKVLSFARANPGRLYIVGDEPDQWCVAPREYADIYYGFVDAVRRVDPTARVSPAGFAEPNDRCCPTEGDEPCRQSKHSVGYAQQFYDEYRQRYGVVPPVNEWRFHDFGLAYAAGDVNGYWSRIDRAASWSVAHGANMFLGAWGPLGWREPVSHYQEHLKLLMNRILNDSRITGAAYWSYEQWAGEHHFLLNPDGSLTAEGQTFANPMADIPVGVALVGSANGHARLKWSNTTAAWGSEVEFWVQPSGSSTFVYHSTKLVGSAGAAQSPVGVFNTGDVVKGRVRYYNRLGQAGWSSFSNAVPMTSTQPQAGQTKVFKKTPIFCFLQFC